MAIVHNGVLFAGTHESPIVAPWPRKFHRLDVFGLDGATELQGGRSPRPIRVPIWLHAGYATSAQLVTALETIEGLIGDEGDLVESGNVSQTWSHVVFDGFAKDQGPIPSSDLGWLAIGMLMFTQLAP